YRRELSPKVNLEAFVDVFNVLDQRAVLLTDDNYTFQAVAPIVNGTPDDLKYAKDVNGAPIQKNANFGNALAYQAPLPARLGLPFTFRPPPPPPRGGPVGPRPLADRGKDAAAGSRPPRIRFPARRAAIGLASPSL